MPITFEPPSHRGEIQEPKFKAGDYVTFEFVENGQRLPKKMNGHIEKSYGNIFYSIIPEGFRKSITDIPEADVCSAAKPIKTKVK